MELDFRRALTDAKLDRIYIAALALKNFRGRKNVEVQLFRHGATEAELCALRGKGLVGAPPAGMPEAIIQGASEDAALYCLLEAFTLPEAEQLADYIAGRYGEQAASLTICPLGLPVPLGVGPLGALPESANSGFLNFHLAPGYALLFQLRGYFDLRA